MSERSKNRLSTRLASYFVRNPLIWSYTAILGTLSLLGSFFDRSGRMQHGFARLWSRLILLTSSDPLSVEGLERIDVTRPAIYTANHSSALDIPVLYVGLPFQFRILAKSELFRMPFMGWHLRRSGQIPIDRSDARQSLRSLSVAAQTAQAGMPLVVFPEGGRSADGRIQPFLGGTFYAAIKAQVPIVPLAIVGTFDSLPMNSFVIRPNRVRLIVGEPIPTTGLSTREMDGLSAQVHEAMRRLYYAHSGLQEREADSGKPGEATQPEETAK